MDSLVVFMRHYVKIQDSNFMKIDKLKNIILRKIIEIEVKMKIKFNKYKILGFEYTKDTIDDLFGRDGFCIIYISILRWMLKKPLCLCKLLFYPIIFLIVLFLFVFLLFIFIIFLLSIFICFIINLIFNIFSLLFCVEFKYD